MIVILHTYSALNEAIDKGNQSNTCVKGLPKGSFPVGFAITSIAACTKIIFNDNSIVLHCECHPLQGKLL